MDQSRDSQPMEFQEPIAMATAIPCPDDANKDRHMCSVCRTTYSKKANCIRHIDAVHGKNTRLMCKNGCDYSTNRADKLKRHHDYGCTLARDGALPKWTCLTCNQSFYTRKRLGDHHKTGHHAQNEHTAKKRKKQHPLQQKEKPEPKPWLVADPLHEPVYPDDAPDELMAEYDRKWHYIRQQTVCDRPFAKLYNVRLTNDVNFQRVMKDIYESANGTPFDIAVEGVPVLHTQRSNPDTGEEEHEFDVRYPSRNTTMVPKTLVTNPADLEKVVETYENADLETLMKVSPSSRWDLRGIAAIYIRIYSRRRFRMIAGRRQTIYNGTDEELCDEDRVIEQFIHDSKSVKALTNDGHHRHLYSDKLCVFRVLADSLLDDSVRPLNPYQMERKHWAQITRGRGGRQGLSVQQLTVRLFHYWAEQTYGPDHDLTVENYIGTKASELPEIERLFDIRLNVYALEVSDELCRYSRRNQNNVYQAVQQIEEQEEVQEIDLAVDDTQPPNPDDPRTEPNGLPANPPVPRERWCQGRLIRRTLQSDNNLRTVDVLLFRNHFYRVTNIKSLCKTWTCGRCGHLFRFQYTCKLHQQVCKETLTRDYPNTSYFSPKTVFQRLRTSGLEIGDPMHKHRIVYDWEAFFKRLNPEQGKLQHVAQLEPLSVSLKSNFRGSDNFDRCKFICEPDSKEVVDIFYETLLKIATEAGEDNAERYREELAFAYDKALPYINLLEEAKEETDEGAKEILKNKLAAAKYDWVTYNMFKKWLFQIPIIGFNSGKFDVNLIRSHLLPLLVANRKEDPVKGIIERGTDFLSISTERMIFLDVCHYLPPGVFLDDFNRTYGSPDYTGKFMWCYEAITCYEDLLKPFPDDKSAFKSTLRNTEITDEQFQEARDFYNRNGCRNMLDMLRLYNDQDVEPFLESVDNFCNIFRNLAGVDIFKSNIISLPGAAMRFMFSRQGDTIIPLFTKRAADWHTRIKANVVGGPAIVFKRLLEVGDPIRDSNNLCRKIVGVDANALYLYCIGQSMPTGIPRYYDLVHPDREVKEIPVVGPGTLSSEDIQASVQHNMGAIMKQHIGYHSKYEVPWVIAAKRKLQALEDQKPPEVRKNLTVQHQFNGGQKWFLSQDGETRIWVDGYIPELNMAIEFCGCYWHGHDCAENTAQQSTEAHHQNRRNKFAEHQWRKQQLELAGVTVQETWECEHPERHDADMQQAISEVLPPLPLGLQTAKRLIERVSDDSFFGILEVDIQVPYWNEQLRRHTSEFPPLFKNVEISREDAGPYMHEYLVEHDQVKQPRRSLIGSYHATKKVLTSPLLKYYLEMGLIVTRLYAAAEYVPAKPFAFVTEEVTEHRKRADDARDNRETQAKSNTAKLLGNSCYGKCLTNIENHDTVKLMTEQGAETAVNHILFNKLDPVDETHYLVHYSKARVMHSLPILVSFFTYQLAKKRMLEFYYNFLLPFVGREKFELLQMDTDSFYMGIAGNDFDEVATSPGYAEAKAAFLEGPNTKRVPGLFKMEWSGEKFIALSAKCYIGVQEDGSQKISSKGVSHRTNSLTYEQYKNVLFDRSDEPVEGPPTRAQAMGGFRSLPNVDLTEVPAVNKGFMRVRGKVTQYQLTKTALSHVYLKRKLSDDMVNTAPLDL